MSEVMQFILKQVTCPECGGSGSIEQSVLQRKRIDDMDPDELADHLAALKASGWTTAEQRRKNNE